MSLQGIPESLRRRSNRRHAALVVALLPGLIVAGLILVDGGGYVTQEPDTVAERANGTAIVKHEPGSLVLYDANGSMRYRNDTYDQYNDVDEIDGTDDLLYVASAHMRGSNCPDGGQCTRIVIETLDRVTHETTRLYEEVNAGHRARGWHDVDRLSSSEYVVADIFHDRVFVLNTTTGIRTWTWNAKTDLPLDGGGPYPDDWTHLNDVEVLPDGRFMASLRNQDMVVFLNESGLQPEWTLGADDDHDVLYEQHNPDYIPATRGGPAVLVADSQNNRVVEYQRTNGSWERSWTWTDERMIWSRDADRLPNGNTLVVDTNGDRVLEIAPNGSVVWEFVTDDVYEAERLGTGDESTGGPSAVAADLQGTGTGEASTASKTESPQAVAKALLPQQVLSGLTYVYPSGIPFTVYFLSIATSVAALVAGLLWGGLALLRRARRVDWRETLGA